MRRAFCLIGLVAAATCAEATDRGAIYLAPTHPVYAYLERLNAKGLLPHAPLGMRPWTRMRLAEELISVRPDDPRLSETDRMRWRFYVGEFADEIAALGADSLLRDVSPAWWSHAAGGHDGWRRALSVYRQGDVEVRLIVAGGVGAQHDTNRVLMRELQAGGWVHLGERWSAQATMRDAFFLGPDAVPPGRFDPRPGIAYIDADTGTGFTVDDPEALVSYSTRLATISFGISSLVFGPGAHAQLVLSRKAPPLPQVRLVVHPWPWLTFTYVHMKLQSGVPDSASAWHRAEPSETGYLRKYYVAHRLELTAIPGVDLGFGESIVYGARGLERAYLIPVVPFRAAQHDVGDLDNLQMWADVAVARIPWTRLYGAWFIDEMSIDALLSGDSMHNWWAWQIGAYVADLWGLVPDFALRVEYVRANPWAYHHRYAWNTYDTWAMHGNEAAVAYPLGFWQGHNGDYVRGDLLWRPRRDMEVMFWASRARRGGEGDHEMQYNPPAEPFLFGPVTTTREAGIEATWELRRDLLLRGRVSHTRRTSEASARRNWTTLAIGITYNVW